MSDIEDQLIDLADRILVADFDVLSVHKDDADTCKLAAYMIKQSRKTNEVLQQQMDEALLLVREYRELVIFLAEAGAFKLMSASSLHVDVGILDARFRKLFTEVKGK